METLSSVMLLSAAMFGTIDHSYMNSGSLRTWAVNSLSPERFRLLVRRPHRLRETMAPGNENGSNALETKKKKTTRKSIRTESLRN